MIVNGEIIAITITDQGSGYTSTPTVTITGDGTGAVASANVAQSFTVRTPESVSVDQEVILTLNWRRIVCIGINSNLSALARLTIWPNDDSGPTAQFSKLHSFKCENSTAGIDQIASLNEVAFKGAVNSNGITPYKLSGTAVNNAPSIPNGGSYSFTLSVLGAALGDLVEASVDTNTLGLQLTANVTAADTVTFLLQNNSGAAVDLPNATYRCLVKKMT